MTDISAFIEKLNRDNIQLQAHNGQLKVEASSSLLTDALRAEITERKAEILAFLSADVSAPGSKVAGKPLSFAQHRLWFIAQLHPEKSLNHIVHGFTLDGNLNHTALQTALRDLLTRHEILRSTIAVVDTEPMLVLQDETSLTIALHDLSTLPPEEQVSSLDILLQPLLQTPFNLETHIPFRAGIFNLAPKKNILVLVIHHIATDGWSASNLRRDLSHLYVAANSRIPHNLPKLSLQYSDYALWQRQWLQGKVLDEHLTFWRKELAGLNPVLQLPTDFPRPAVATFQAAEWQQTLNSAETAKLRTFSKQQNVTLFMTLFVTLQVLFYRLSGQTDFALATPVANRQRQDLENLVGFFVNTLLLRSSVTVSDSFLTLLQLTRKRTLAALNFPYLPFDRLIQELNPERKQDQTPLAQVLVSMQNVPARRNNWGNLHVTPFPIPEQTLAFDLEIYIREDQDQLKFTWLYRKDLWTATTIELWGKCFQTLLSQSISAPEKNATQLPILDAEFHYKLLQRWSSGSVLALHNQCVHHLFERQVLNSPNAIALNFDNQTVSYQTLNERSNQLAHYLLHKNISIESPIMLCLERSVEVAVSLLGSLKAGCAYVPINPDLPAKRIAYMVQDTQPSLIITQQHLLPLFMNIDSPILAIDDHGHLLQDQPLHNPERVISLKNLAYILYTSGSTGHPKGVMVEHYALVNFLIAIQHEIFHPQPGDECLNISPISFDIAALEIYLPLISGATVTMIDSPAAKNAEQLKQFIECRPIALMQATPTTYQLLSLVGWTPHKGLTLLCGGEKLSRNLAQSLLQPETTVWNLYGPTETTVWSTCYRVTEANQIIPIGRPIANTDVYILDQQLQPVPVSVWGELAIGGFGLARGYLNNPALTQERFITHPFSKNSAARLYRTGDKVRWLADGTIEFAERFDRQVKIRGHRIELEEIEALLTEQSQIQSAVVVVTDDALEPRLLAYCIGDNSALSEQELRQTLKLSLPDYMIPQHIIFVDAFPLSPNGKLDLNTLMRLRIKKPATNSIVEAQSQTETQLIQIWTDILQPSAPISVKDNFFELGGTSLASIQVLTAIENTFQRKIPLATLFQWTTIADLAVFMDSPEATNTPIPELDHTSPLDPELYRYLLGLALGHTEPRLNPASLIFQLNEPSEAPALYLCGADREIAAQCRAFQVFGMATAYGLMPLTPSNISHLAQHYVGEILAHNPVGPYYIGGYCIGGRIAYEMAKLLQAQGKTVALLLLIDQLLYEPYSGAIAFFIFQYNSLLKDLQQPGSSKLLRKYFPRGWSVDTIPGTHSTTITYATAMVLNERISARCKPSSLNALPKAAYKVDWQLLDKSEQLTSITLTFSIKNNSAVTWQAGQIAIGHHWQDLQGVLVGWAEKCLTFTEALLSGQAKIIHYTLERPCENNSLFAIIDLFGHGNTWFSLQDAPSFSVLVTGNVNLSETPAQLLHDITALEAAGTWHQVIPLYEQLLLSKPENDAKLVMKLAEALIQTGRTESAKTILQTLLTRSDVSRDDQIVLHLLLANLHLNNDAYVLAISEAKLALAQQSDHKMARVICGLAYAQTGNFKAADHLFDEAIALYSPHKLPLALLTNLEKFCFLIDKQNNDGSLKIHTNTHATG